METMKPDQAYLERVMTLSREEAQTLAAQFDARSRTSPSAPHLNTLERAALQLHFEEQALAQWRDNIGRLYTQQAA